MIKIHTTERGLMLVVNGKAVKKSVNSINGIECTPVTGKPTNWVCTEFSTLESLRSFWRSYMGIIVFESNK
jgi:hypothetical protein